MHTSPTLAEFLSELDSNAKAFVPLLYVAWSEAQFSAPEMRQIFGKLQEREDLDQSLLARLEPFMIPEAALTPQHLNQVRSHLQSWGQGAQAHKLVDFCRQFAAKPLSESDEKLLFAIEEALSLVGEATPSELCPPPVQPVPTHPSIDLPTLRQALAGARPEVRQRVFELLEHPRFSHEYGLSTQAFRERVFAWMLELTAEGYARMAYPKELQGGGDLLGFLSAMEALAHFDLSLIIKFGVNFGLYGNSVFHLGTDYHHRTFLPRLFSGELPGCFAMTETGHGSNVRSIETCARYDKERREFIIHTPNPAARKDYIGNAALHGRMATVFAQLEVDGAHYGVHAFLVPIRDAQHHPAADVQIEDCGEKIGLNGVDNGRLRFNSVRIPRENMLNRFANVSPEGEYSSPIASPTKRFFTMIATLVSGRITLAAASSSVSKNALTVAIRYGEARRQFGPEGGAEQKILDYQTHQRRLMPLLASTFALHFAVQGLLRKYDESGADEKRMREVESLAAGLKAWGTWHALETVQVCRECCGGQGYLAVNRFGTLKADLDIFTTFEGDNHILLQQVAKSLLTDYRQQFSELRFMGLLQYLTRRAGAAVSDLNPLTTRNTDPAHLRDADFYLKAMRLRESSLLASVARRLKRALEGGQDSLTAFNSCQDHLVTLAKASMDRVVCESFYEAVTGYPEASGARLLRTVCDLFALSRLEKERAWFLENGYFEGSKSKAIRNQVLALCAEVRQHATLLVDCFAIPAKLIAAPIGLGEFPAPPVVDSPGP